jgi:hypothetical protein
MNIMEAQFFREPAAAGTRLPVVEWSEGPSLSVKIRTRSFSSIGASPAGTNNYGARNFDFFKYRALGGLVRFRRMRWRGHLAG